MPVSNIGSGQTYTTIADWEAATDNDLTGGGGTIETGELTDASYAETVVLAGATTSSTGYRHLTADPGNEYDPIAGTGATITATTDTGVVEITENYARLSRIRVANTGAGTTQRRVIKLVGTNTVVLAVVADGSSATTSNTNVGSAGFYCDPAGSGNIFSSIAIGGGAAGNYNGFYGNNNAWNWYNCVAYDFKAYGFNMGSAMDSPATVENCIAMSNATEDFSSLGGTTAVSNNCLSDDATADDLGGTGHVINETVANIFTDAANDDFSIVASSAAHNTGKDLTSAYEAVFGSGNTPGFKPGIDHGTENSTWEMGAYDGIVGGQARIMAATIDTTMGVSAALLREAPLAATLAATSDAVAALNRTVGFAATIDTASDAIASVQVGRPLAATLDAASDASAVLSVERQLAATLDAASEAVAALGVAFPFAATLDAASDALAALSIDHSFAATLEASSDATAALLRSVEFAAVLAAASDATAELTTTSGFAATLDAASSVTAGLDVARVMAAILDAASDAAAAIVRSVELSATLNAASSMSAELTTQHSENRIFEALLDATFGAFVELSTERRFSATIDALSSAVSRLDVDRGFAATLDAASAMSAHLKLNDEGEFLATLDAASGIVATMAVARAFSQLANEAADLAIALSTVRAYACVLEATSGMVASLSFAPRPFIDHSGFQRWDRPESIRVSVRPGSVLVS